MTPNYRNIFSFLANNYTNQLKTHDFPFEPGGSYFFAVTKKVGKKLTYLKKRLLSCKNAKVRWPAKMPGVEGMWAKAGSAWIDFLFAFLAMKKVKAHRLEGK